MNLAQLNTIQQQLAQAVDVPSDCAQGYTPQADDLIYTLDIQYQDEEAFVAIDIQAVSGKHFGVFVHKAQTGMPYVPRFFCFREGPPLLQSIQKVVNHTQLIPKILLVDGHSIAHPHKLGVASWLGVKAALPAIGVAKRTLLPYNGQLKQAKGSTLDVRLNDEVVGKVLRSREGVKPVFVSVGNRICLAEAVKLTLALSDPYRIAEPMRRADHAARAFAKGQTLDDDIVVVP